MFRNLDNYKSQVKAVKKTGTPAPAQPQENAHESNNTPHVQTTPNTEEQSQDLPSRGQR